MKWLSRMLGRVVARDPEMEQARADYSAALGRLRRATSEMKGYRPTAESLAELEEKVHAADDLMHQAFGRKKLPSGE